MNIKKLFPSQEEDEVIVLVVREHWFFMFTRVLAWLIFVAVLFLFDKYAPQYIPKLFEAPYLNFVNLGKNIYVMFLVLGLFMLWTIYYLNVQIVTNKRIVDIWQKGIFSQRISELTLPNIEDVTSEVKGFWATVLGYGNVEIQTAGEKENFIFQSVPEPREIEKMIINQTGLYRGPKGNE